MLTPELKEYLTKLLTEKGMSNAYCPCATCNGVRKAIQIIRNEGSGNTKMPSGASVAVNRAISNLPSHKTEQ